MQQAPGKGLGTRTVVAVALANKTARIAWGANAILRACQMVRNDPEEATNEDRALAAATRGKASPGFPCVSDSASRDRAFKAQLASAAEDGLTTSSRPKSDFKNE